MALADWIGGGRYRRAAVLFAVVVAAVVFTRSQAAQATTANAKVGGLTVHHCGQSARVWCGTRSEPWDRSDPAAGSLQVGFKLFMPPQKPSGVVVAVEGGPGYPSIGSAPEYRALFGPLLKTRALLLVDSRGTGQSAVIACKALQRYEGRTDIAKFQQMVGKCGQSLGTQVGLYRTNAAADDVADVVRAVGLGKIDLYGDSYGSWFVQAFAARHPALLRSLMLDSTYSRTDIDPWYRSTLSTERSAFRAVCARDVSCSVVPGDPWQRIAKLAARLRQKPISGWTTDPEGAREFQTVTVRTLVDVTADAGFDPLIYRNLDAAVRAAQHGVTRPLLRLAANAAAIDNTTPRSAADYSDGQYFAVACADYPQLFDMSATPAQRRAQLQSAVAAGPGAALRPFRPSEWISMNQYSEASTGCLDWPQLTTTAPRGIDPSNSVPTLVIGGDLDSWTPAADAAQFAHTLGTRVRLVVMRNAVHTATEGDIVPTAATACGRSIVRAFVRKPAAVDALDASCAAHVPAIHTPGTFPKLLQGVRGARVAEGSAGATARRAATVAAQAIGDATGSWWSDDGDSGAGLYGGTFAGTGDAVVQMHLHGYRWVADATVTGTATWTLASGRVRGRVTVQYHGHSAIYTIAYSQAGRWAVVRSGETVFSTPAP